MTFYIREKVIGYRTSTVEADTYEEAERKWLRADGLRTYDVDVMSAEMLSLEDEGRWRLL